MQNPTGEDPPPSFGKEELNRLVIEFLDRFDGDRDGLLDAMCREHPGCADDLRRRVDLLADAGLLYAGHAEDAPIPERLGSFRLLSRLGGGGMGVVYLAHDETLEREVALKVVRPEQLFFDEARARFRREVATIAKLSHRGIVPVHSVGEQDGLPYFAMERVRGATLAATLAALPPTSGRTGTDLERAVVAATGTVAAQDESAPGLAPLFAPRWDDTCARIVREVAEALEHAHRLGIVHRDVKSSNIMVTPGGRVMLLDFGLSSEERPDRLTRTGSRVGSLPYMSPEQLAGSPADRRSDVYGLGVTLYELLTLRLPFEAKTVAELRELVARGQPVPIRKLEPEVSWELETVCLTALDPDPARRYASAEDFARDLTNVIERRPIAARRAGFWRRSRRWVERHPARAVGAVAGFLLIGVAPGLFAWQQYRAARALEAKQTELSRAYGDLERSLGEADEARELAQANFGLASDAVDRMLTRVADEVLVDVPLVDEVRRRILQDALEFEEALLAVRPTDEAQRLDRARSLRRVADIHGMLGEYRASSAAFEEYLAELESLAPDARDRADLHERAECFAALARAYRLQDAPTEAVAAAQRGLALLDRGFPEPATDRRDPETDATTEDPALLAARLHVELAEIARRDGGGAEEFASLTEAVEQLRPLVDGPESEKARTLLARALHALGTPALLEERIPPDEIARRRPLLEEAVSLRAALAADDPEPAERRDWVDSLVSLGNTYLYERELGAARDCFSQAVEAARALWAEHPAVLSFADGVAVSATSLATVAGLEGRTDEENELLREALDAYDAIFQRDPGNFDAARKSLYAHHNIGLNIVNADAGDFEEGEYHFRRCVELRQALRGRNLPATLADGSVGAQALLGYCQARQGKHVEGSLSVQAMLDLGPDPAQIGIGAAVLAQCMDVARHDSELSADERLHWEEEHAAFAIDLLAQALTTAGGEDEVRAILDQDALEPLRQRRDYGILLADLGLGPPADGD